MVGNALLTFTYITHCIDSLQESFYLREREDADIPKKKKKSWQNCTLPELSYPVLCCRLETARMSRSCPCAPINWSFCLMKLDRWQSYVFSI